MVILALDTSSAATSAALIDGDRVLAVAEHVDARRHAELLAPMVAEILDTTGNPPVGTIAVGVGPGPYTGLRVGIATAQGLALGWGVPAVGICSLDVIAERALDAGVEGPFIAASDARRGEVYWASYDAAGVRIDGPFVGRVADLDEEVRAMAWVGDGAVLHLPVAVAPRADALRYPRADALGRLVSRLLADGGEPAAPALALSAHGEDDGSTSRSLGSRRLLTLAPLYVRRPDAAEPGAVA